MICAQTVKQKKMGADGSATGAVVFGSDQGLVGQFNDSIAEHAAQTLAPLPGRKKIWAVGERVHDRLADLGRIFRIEALEAAEQR